MTHSAAVPATAVADANGRPIPWWRFAPLADGVVLCLAAAVERIGGSSLGVAPLPTAWLVMFPAIALGLLACIGLYKPRLRFQLLDDIAPIAGATAIAAMATVTVTVLGGESDVAVQGVRLWLFSTVYLVASRAGVISSVVASRREGSGARPTLIVGAGSVGRLLAKRLSQHPEIGLRPVGFLDKDPRALEDTGVDGPTLPVLGASWDLGAVIDTHRVEHVVFTFSTAPHDVMLRMVDECTRRGVRVSIVPRLFERVPRSVSVDYLGAVPLVSINPSSPQSRRYKLKYAVDRVVAAVALLFVSPVFLAVAVGVLVSSGRPIFYRQKRVGCDGRVFDMLKFRSMTGDGPSRDVYERATFDVGPGGVEGDDRRTGFGAFIRRTSLDELAQLLNVLRGDMSLVGPRPERPEFVELFTPRIKRYGDRHRVKSGITGWAQVHGLRGKTSLADRVEWDNWYIENWSLWLDLKILVATVRAVLRPAAVE